MRLLLSSTQGQTGGSSIPLRKAEAHIGFLARSLIFGTCRYFCASKQEGHTDDPVLHGACIDSFKFADKEVLWTMCCARP